MNKKGIVPDMQFVIITFFIFLLVTGITATLWYNINDKFQDLPSDVVSDRVKGQIDDLGNIFNFIDKLVPFIFIILWGLVLFFSVTVTPDHPIFFIISFAGVFLISLLSVVFADLGTELFNNTFFSPVIDQISNTVFFANNYHYISFGVMLISLVIFFSKNKIGLGGGAGIE